MEKTDCICKQEEKRIFLSVEFCSPSHKTYYYLTDDDSIEAEDFVVVPAGKFNDEALVRVVKKEYFSESQFPINPEKLKSIIKKTDKTWDTKENIEEKMLKSFSRQVEIIDKKYKIFDGLVVCVTTAKSSKSGFCELCLESKGQYLTFTSDNVISIGEVTPKVIFGELKSRKVYCRLLKKYIEERICINISNANKDDEFVPFDVEEVHKVCNRCSECTLM